MHRQRNRCSTSSFFCFFHASCSNKMQYINFLKGECTKLHKKKNSFCCPNEIKPNADRTKVLCSTRLIERRAACVDAIRSVSLQTTKILCLSKTRGMKSHIRIQNFEGVFLHLSWGVEHADIAEIALAFLWRGQQQLRKGFGPLLQGQNFWI
jgi:hypothetical protein